MRITQNLSNRNFLYNIENLNTRLEDASQEVSTGKKLNHLNDSPSGSAELVELHAEASQVDQYRTNSDTGSFLLGMNDQVLTSVHDLMTSVFTRGSDAASTYNDAGSRATLTQDIRSLRDQILSLANTESSGRYLFSGSKVTSPAFTISVDTVSYQGDDVVNTIEAGDSLSVQVNFDGNRIFKPIFDAINGLLTALDNNDQTAIQGALNQFSPALNILNKFRGQVGVNLSRLQNVGTELDSLSTSISTRQGHIEDANMAEAITRLTQVQTGIQSALTAQSSTDRRNLFDFMA
jgi:flagellar hook-associated protein 3 FlgL